MVSVSEAWSARGAAYAESAPHKHGPSLPKLLALARPGPSDVCLDIGTGAGHTAAALAKHAARVYGLDPAEGMRRAAQASYGHLENLEFVPGTSEATGFADATFDIVTARHTLHHHPDLTKTCLEIARILKPGGRLVIVDEITPNKTVEAWYHELELTRDPTHNRAYFLEEWRTFIREAGLDWVVGDAQTVYTLEVEPWIARMDPSDVQAQRVRDLFLAAPDVARATFAIRYSGNDAVTFDMPMALILAVKPEGDVQ